MNDIGKANRGEQADPIVYTLKHLGITHAIKHSA